MTCRGPAGCAKSGGESSCDQTVAEDKDVCNLANDYVCTSDKKGMLECSKNRWTFVQACLGDRNCAMEAKKVTCDNSIANGGDACREEDDYACSPDKKTRARLPEREVHRREQLQGQERVPRHRRQEHRLQGGVRRLNREPR